MLSATLVRFFFAVVAVPLLLGRVVVLVVHFAVVMIVAFISVVIVMVVIAFEVAVSYPRLRPWAPRAIHPRRVPWFWAGLASFGIAFFVWNLSRTGRVWCNPDTLLQGHALWHVLSAVSVGCFYLYFRADGARSRT